MQACPWGFLKDNKKHIISLVGGGGKTTIMYELARYWANLGRRVVCMTTTHIWLPYISSEADSCAYAYDMDEVRQLWQQGRYAVIGTQEEGTGKLVLPQSDLLNVSLDSCNIALVEADGAKQMPCKLPAEHEPVLLPKSDIVIAVAGLDALGKSLEEACFRWQLGRNLFSTSCDLLIDELKLAQILLSEKGSRKFVGSRDFFFALNKCDLVEPERVLCLRKILLEQGMRPDQIWLRGR